MTCFRRVPSSSTSCRSSWHWRHCRVTRRTSTPARSRSRRKSAAEGVGGSFSSSRLAFTNSRGSASRRSRSAGPLSRHATYSSPTSRVDSASGAISRTRRSQSSGLARAMGTMCFIAAWAPMRPRRTSSCTISGSSLTRASRRDTQLWLRPKRCASTSWPRPKLDSSSASSQPCSSADSPSAARSVRLRSNASTSSIGHTVVMTVSCPSRFAARIRL